MSYITVFTICYVLDKGLEKISHTLFQCTPPGENNKEKSNKYVCA